MNNLPLSLQANLNQPHYQTQHQFAPVKDLSEPAEIEPDDFELSQRDRGLWAFIAQTEDDEFTGYIDCERDGTFSMHITASNKITQMTHYRFDHLRDAMRAAYLEWMKGGKR